MDALTAMKQALEALRQAEYDLGWEDCSRLYGEEVKRLRGVLQRIASGDPDGDYVRFTLDEAMARSAEAALSVTVSLEPTFKG